jgi:hypothetical protein
MKKPIKKLQPPNLPIKALMDVYESLQELKALMKKAKVHNSKPKAQ